MRKMTETMDPMDFLQFAQQGFGFAVVPSPLIDFGAVMDTSNHSGEVPVWIADDFPGEVFGGTFWKYRGAGEVLLTTQDIIRFKKDATTIAQLRVNAGNDKLELLVNGSIVTIGTHNIALLRNYHLQWNYQVGVSGLFEVKLDEDLDVLTYSGDTTAGLASYVNRLEFSADNTGHQFDSIYVNDTTGVEDNGYGGIVRMISAVPTADGFWVDWPLSAGSDGFAMVDETPHDIDVTYAYSNVNGQKRSFTVPGHGLVSPAFITAVSARWVVRKVSNGRVRPFFRIGGVDYPIAAASVPVGVGYMCVMDRRTQNPDTAADWALGDTIDSVGLESVL